MEIISALGVSGLVAISVVIMVGAAVQAATGFGLALLCVPLLFMLDQRFVPGPLLAAGIICSLGAAVGDRQEINRRWLGLMIAGMVIGSWIGVAGLKATQGMAVAKLFGGLVLVAVALSVSGWSIRATWLSLVAASAVGGAMGAMVGIHGPPVALVLQHETPAKVRAMLGAFFAIAYGWTVVVMALFGLFGRDEVVRAAILVPGMCLGLALAPALIATLDARRLRWIILSISAASAILLLCR